MGNNKWGFIDKKGKMVLNPPPPAPTQVSDVAWPEDRRGRSGTTRSDNNPVLIPPATPVERMPVFKPMPELPQYDVGPEGFSEGLAVVSFKGLYGYIDRSGKTIVPPKYSAAQNFYQGLARVHLHGKFGYIDRAGNVIWWPAN